MRRFVTIPALLSYLILTVLISVSVGYHPPYVSRLPQIPQGLHVGDDRPPGLICGEGSMNYSYYMRFEDYCYIPGSDAMITLKANQIASIHLYSYGHGKLTLGDVVAEWGPPRWLLTYSGYAPDAYWDDKHAVTTGPDFSVNTPVCCIVWGVDPPVGQANSWVHWRGFGNDH